MKVGEGDRARTRTAGGWVLYRLFQYLMAECLKTECTTCEDRVGYICNADILFHAARMKLTASRIVGEWIR